MAHPHLTAMLTGRRMRTEPRRHGTADVIRNRFVASDERWPRLVAVFERLRSEKRHSVRIVDADCGSGAFLLHAVQHARALGFTAIEGRGIDGVPALVARARASAAALHDPAIGLSFEAADLSSALADEAEFPADILLWHGHADTNAAGADAVAAAGRVVISDGRDRLSLARNRP